MKLNNKGFAISSIMYIILVLAVILIALTLAIFSSRKLILDKQKNDALHEIYQTRYKNGDIVYFDIEKGIGCTEEDYDETNSNTGYNGINNKIYTTTYRYEYSISEKEQLQSSCLKFYVFNDNGGDTVNLLLDHNTSLYVAWNASENNILGPSKVLEQLKVDTDNWKGTQVLSNYLLFQGENYANYSVDYSNYRARLITAGEIAKITNNELFDETKSSSKFYFDSNLNTPSDNCQEGNTTGCKFGWLYDRTSSNCKDYGCLNNSNTKEGSYWTSTAVSGITTDSWRIGVTGLNYGGVVIGTQYDAGPGVRPVIEVLRENLL